MAQMAQGGARFLSGTFTVPSDASSPYVLPFGKTFNKYLFFIEMTDDSKSSLIGETSITASKGYSMYGIYPNRTINNKIDANNAAVYVLNPSTGNISRTTGNLNSSGSKTQLGLECDSLSTGAAVRVYKGMTYNYFVAEMS